MFFSGFDWVHIIIYHMLQGACTVHVEEGAVGGYSHQGRQPPLLCNFRDALFPSSIWFSRLLFSFPCEVTLFQFLQASALLTLPLSPGRIGALVGVSIRGGNLQKEETEKFVRNLAIHIAGFYPAVIGKLPEAKAAESVADAETGESLVRKYYFLPIYIALLHLQINFSLSLTMRHRRETN